MLSRYICAILLSVLIFITVNVNAQAPVINVFTPSAGPVGTTVNIDGSNFNANSAGNIVYFGAVKANVISASSTRLTVTAPQGATYQPISVTSNGLTGYAKLPFITTFNSTPFTLSSLNGKIDFESGNAPDGLAIKDLDSDGKPDIAVTNSSSNNISFFKNNSQSGVAVFTLALNKSVSDYPIGIAVDDLDGDGKPDVVVANFNSYTISVLKNISANNQIKFADAVTFATGVAPYNIAIADFNGDGKPDLAVTNEYSYPANISVFTNSTIQNGPISFLAKADFPSLAHSRGITAADVDLDGKADLIVPSQGGFVSVFRNTSVGNAVNFDTKIDYDLPFASGAESVVVTDLDGDNKPDIAVADNNTDGTVSVLKNNSSAGAISFINRRDFATGKDPFSICAGDINGDGKPDLAVCNQFDNSVSVLINTSLPGSVNFNNPLDFAVGSFPRSAAMGDIDGSGRPDLVIGNSGGTTTSILLANAQKLQSIINFPPAGAAINIDNSNILHPGATSTNGETPITYTSSNPAIAYVDADGLIHVLAPGTIIITASQSGNDNYNPATPVQQRFIIKENQIIDFQPFVTTSTCTADFNANATSNTTMPITYASSNLAVATINAQGLIHITGPGSTIITASQSGNDLYNASPLLSHVLTVTLPVNQTVTITADNTSVCQGASINLTANVANTPVAQINYQWHLNGVNTGTNSSVLTITSAAVTDVFDCAITEVGSCVLPANSNSISNINFLPYQTPSVIITSSIQSPVCSGTTVTFTAVPAYGGNNPIYQWKINEIPAGNNEPKFTTNTLSDNDKISCDITNNSSPCVVNKSAISNVLSASIIHTSAPVLTVAISASASNIYEGALVNFVAEPSITSIVSNYQWQVNGTNVIGANSYTFSTNQLKNDDEVTCIVTSTDACSVPSTSAPIKITVQLLNVTIPNTFSPNGDGINDFWRIPALANYLNCSVKIFNRYGQLVYDAKGYSKPWDGTYKGIALPVSTYYYIIKLDIKSKSQPFSGSLTIIR